MDFLIRHVVKSILVRWSLKFKPEFSFIHDDDDDDDDDDYYYFVYWVIIKLFLISV